MNDRCSECGVVVGRKHLPDCRANKPVSAEQGDVAASKVKARIFASLSIGGSGACWEWKGRLNNGGYGVVSPAGGKPWYLLVHRFMYELVRGPIPDNLQIDHLCRNRACANPSHLELVTARENTHRGTGPTAENARKEFCKRGHALTPENVYLRSDRRGRHCRACMRLEQNERRRVFRPSRAKGAK